MRQLKELPKRSSKKYHEKQSDLTDISYVEKGTILQTTKRTSRRQVLVKTQKSMRKVG